VTISASGGAALALVLCLQACSSTSAGEGGNGPPALDGRADTGTASHDAGTRLDAMTRADARAAIDATVRDGALTGQGEAGAGPTFAGCPLFASDYAYNQDVSLAPADPGSAAYLANLTNLAPGIAAEFPGGEYYNIVPSTQAPVAVQTASAYGFRADGGFFDDTDASLAAVSAPIPAAAVYENQVTPNADHHLMVLEQGACVLYELYGENPASATTGWDVMVEWSLHGNPQIPDALDLGSTTQAGTPLLPGIVWPVEVETGAIDHALDIVLADTAIMPCAYVHPASTVRYSGAPAGQGVPYGTRFRLKPTFDASSFEGSQAKTVIRTLQKFGSSSDPGAVDQAA
jgi:hypothetical protein